MITSTCKIRVLHGHIAMSFSLSLFRMCVGHVGGGSFFLSSDISQWYDFSLLMPGPHWNSEIYLIKLLYRYPRQILKLC